VHLQVPILNPAARPQSGRRTPYWQFSFYGLLVRALRRGPSCIALQTHLKAKGLD